MKESQNSFKFLMLASLLTIVLYFIPYAKLVLYPFELFVTYVHETSHALAALLTLGSVGGMRIHPDTSGETLTAGGIRIVISTAGYVGSTIFGALLLMLCQRGEMAKKILAGTALGILAVTLIFMGFGYVPFLLSILLSVIAGVWFLKPTLAEKARFALGGSALVTILALFAFLGATNSLFGWIVGLTIGTALFLSAKYLSPSAAHFLLSFLAVQCCLNALFDLSTLILLSLSSPVASDARNMEMSTGIPAIFWAVTWGMMSISILAAALWKYRRNLSLQPKLAVALPRKQSIK